MRKSLKKRLSIALLGCLAFGVTATMAEQVDKDLRVPTCPVYSDGHRYTNENGVYREWDNATNNCSHDGGSVWIGCDKNTLWGYYQKSCACGFDRPGSYVRKSLDTKHKSNGSISPKSIKLFE